MSYWSSYLFQYAVGGVVFCAALWLGTRADGDRVIWRGGRWGFPVLLGGLVLYAAVHAGWIVAAAAP